MEPELNLDTPWSIGEAAFEFICLATAALEPDTIVEFGSGASSIRLARAFPQAQIISVEGSREYFEETCRLKAKLAQTDNLKVIFARVKLQFLLGGLFISYKMPKKWVDRVIDCVIIDGPSYSTIRGREACLYYVYSQLRVGGMVILDDLQRRDEQLILKNWQLAYPESFTVEVIDVGHKLAVLRKEKEVRLRAFVAGKFLDNLHVNARLLYGKLRLITSKNALK